MSIKNWNRHDRPRERLVRLGANALSDAECLALLLRCTRPGTDAVSHARHIIAQSGDLNRLISLSFPQFLTIEGVGAAAYASLHAGVEIARRRGREQLMDGQPLADIRAAKTYLMSTLGHLRREAFGVVFLDAKHRVLAYETLFFGTVDSATVHPREVVRRTLELNAAAVIFAHNHPSGDTTPSDADRRLTGRLTAALRLIDVRVLDHFVVAKSAFVSFAERGLIPDSTQT